MSALVAPVLAVLTRARPIGLEPQRLSGVWAAENGKELNFNGDSRGLSGNLALFGEQFCYGMNPATSQQIYFKSVRSGSNTRGIYASVGTS